MTIDFLHGFICRIADRLNRKSFSFRMNEGALLYLDDIRLFRPTADAGTLVQLEMIFDTTARDMPAELRLVLEKIIIRESVTDPEFDFRKIESLTASTGFGEGFFPHINGSWFTNLQAWGKGMYPGDNLRSDTQQDWNGNVWHIEHEGFSRNVPVRVKYYGWYDRYVASNSGGSHHAAKVIWQGHRDNIPYHRQAVIEKLSIDAEAVRELESRFYSFMFLPRQRTEISDADNFFRLLLREQVSTQIRYLRPRGYPENLVFAFVPRDGLKSRQEIFSQWLITAAQAGKLIPLADYLKKPQAFHNKPYLHEVKNIYLGVPF